MTKELTIKPDQAIAEVGNQIDSIINECLPVVAQESQNFVQALTLANGIKALQQIFLTDKNIKETIKSMQNTHLGFMTDRTDLAIWKSKQSGSGGKELKPYRYEDVADVCIEAMLKGYRITNNEFNMITGRFYAAKNGKFRRIQECEGLTNFQFTTTSPAYEKEQGGIQYAKVQGFASWKINGQLDTIGSSATETEDKLVFKIRVNKHMGEDAIVGKALSKLFSRVLMRLEGKIMPEATDVSNDDVVDAEFETSDLSEKIKQAEKEQPKDEKEDVPKYGSKEYARAMVEKTEGLEEKPLTKHVELGPAFAKTHETVEENKEDADLQKMEEKKQETSKEFDWEAFREEWINLRTPGFSSHVHKNRSKWDNAPAEMQAEGQEKWVGLYRNVPWPVKNKPVDDEEDKVQMIKAMGDYFEQSDITKALHEHGQTTLTACDMATLRTIYKYLRENADNGEELV